MGSRSMRIEPRPLAMKSISLAFGAGVLMLPRLMLGVYAGEAHLSGYSLEQVSSTVEFFAPPLPSQGHRRDRAVSEWSYLDDTDSVFVVLKGSAPGDTVTASVQVYVQRIPWEGEVATLPDSIASDTVGHWITWKEITSRMTRASRYAFGGRFLTLLHPTLIQNSARLALKHGQFVTRIRVCTRLNGRNGPQGEIKVLQSS
jgi:hypothetical protein